MDLNDELFKTYVVIEFDSKCKSDIKRWLENKLKAPKDKNGAELLTKFSTNSKNEVFKRFYFIDWHLDLLVY